MVMTLRDTIEVLFWHLWILCRADLANLVNEAALLAGRNSKTVVEKIDFIHAVERSIAVKLTLPPPFLWRMCHFLFPDMFLILDFGS